MKRGKKFIIKMFEPAEGKNESLVINIVPFPAEGQDSDHCKRHCFE